jgi:SAM-dependent methyltransferase
MNPRSPSHLDHVRNDDAYADILAGWDAAFYAKFTDTLRPTTPGGRLLDIGCGVGQVVATLTREGFEAHGVDVAAPNIDRTHAFTNRCLLYDGGNLPYPDNHFDTVGALNVVEHVEDPEDFIREAVRVCKPGGRVVLSSPNFLRFLGFRDYHPRMRGIGNKWRNLHALLDRRRRMNSSPADVRFERMTPIIKEPFTPDDDAIVCTNALDIAFFLERSGCRIERVECTDRYVPAALGWLLNLTPLKFGLFNAFVVGRKR